MVMREKYFVRTRWTEVDEALFHKSAQDAGIDPDEMFDDGAHTQTWHGTGFEGVRFTRTSNETDAQFNRRIQVHFHGEDAVAYTEKLMGEEVN